MNVEPTGPPVARRGAAPEPVRAGDAAGAPLPTAGLLVSVSIAQTEPLTGTATCAEGTPISFVGWLELLRAISELVGADGRGDDGGPPARERITG